LGNFCLDYMFIVFSEVSRVLELVLVFGGMGGGELGGWRREDIIGEGGCPN